MKRCTVFLVLLGCAKDKYEYKPTPQGYQVAFQDQGSFASGLLTRTQVTAWLNSRIEVWVAERKGQFGESKCRQIAQDTTYLLVDNWRFEAQPGQGNWVHGPRMGNAVALSIWSYKDVPTKPMDATTRMAVQNADGTWRVGYLPPEGGLDVTGWELSNVAGFQNDPNKIGMTIP